MNLRIGEEIELEIESLAYGGAGVARVDGLVIFVSGALPAERVRARVLALKGSYGNAEATAVVRPSPDRVVAPCAHFGPCGGCQWMSLAYPAQLAAKESQVRESLRRIGGLTDYTFHPIAPSPHTLAYRNRMEFAVAPSAHGLTAGLHAAADPSRIVEIDRCLIQDDRANEILAVVVGLCRDLGVAPCPRAAAGSGSSRAAACVKRLVLRRGSDRRFLVALGTGAGPFPDGPVLARKVMERVASVSGVVRVMLPFEGSGSDPRTGRVSLLAGTDRLEDTIGGLRLQLTAGAFLQVNPEQAERLYAKVLELAGDARSETVLDLYSGVGAIALLFGRCGAKVTAVEASEEAVRCAEENARANGIESCRFLRGDARRVLAGMVAAGEGAGIAVLNPPRTGLGRDVAGTLVRLDPSCIVYVSCNPTTLARDLARLTAFGYRVTDVAPFDMFPHTYHIETIARLERARRG